MIHECLRPTTRDPVLAFLLSGSRQRIWRLAAIGALLTLIPAVAAAFEGVLIDETLQPDLLRDYAYWTKNTLGVPLVLLSVGLFLYDLPAVIDSMRTRGNLRFADDEYMNVIRWGNRVYANRLASLIPLVVSSIALIMTLVTITFGPSNAWQSPASGPKITVAGILSILFIAPTYYLVGLGVTRVIQTFFVFRRLFHGGVRLLPLHEDGCGGFCSIGSLYGRLNWGVLFFGLAAGVAIVTNLNRGWPLLHVNNLIVIASYVGGATAVVFVPLVMVHRHMMDERRQVLATLRAAFENSIRRTGESDLGSLSLDQMERAQSIQWFHSLIRQLPTYPFDSALVSGFLASVALPLSLALLSELLGLSIP